MVDTCSALNCRVRRERGVKLKFHCIPKDPLLRKAWLDAIKRLNFNPSPRTFICEKHFTQQDYEVNVHGNRVLKKGAIPSVFDFPRDLIETRPLIKVIQNEIVQVNSAKTNVAKTYIPNQGSPIINFPNELSNPGYSRSTDPVEVQEELLLNIETEEDHYKLPFTAEDEELVIERESDRRSDLEYFGDIKEMPLDTQSKDEFCERACTTVDLECFGDIQVPLNVDNKIIYQQPPIAQQQNQLERKCVRNRRSPVYFGDFQRTDLDNEGKRTRFWMVANETVSKYKKLIKYYELKTRRQQYKIENLSGLVNSLRNHRKSDPSKN